MGVAPAPGVAVKGVWRRIARAFERGDATALEETERIELEADFGVGRGDPAAVAFDAVDAAVRRGVIPSSWTQPGGCTPRRDCSRS